MLRKVWERWKVIAHAIGTFQARLVLGTLYLFVVGPVALVRRLVADPLGLRRTPRPTYWVPRPAPADSLDAARRQ